MITKLFRRVRTKWYGVLAGILLLGAMGAIGIARKDDADLLAAAGADIVVETLDEVDLGALADGRLAAC